MIYTKTERDRVYTYSWRLLTIINMIKKKQFVTFFQDFKSSNLIVCNIIEIIIL